ncbi:MAG: bifunctional alpha,alpha-trehalose-phosphate synthase (UDP-forming)/trehalose-phosphatase [Desulfobacteraceae bacterium]|nr:bifunctional alpha,alpha-trehalose-phosphate synthase (UDP-forming)/trehalose-phosphatase [Desulfobacteraceae bacterium]
MPRLIVVSNRLPVSITKCSGEIHLARSAGGKATGLSSLCKSYEGAWIGWPGTTSEKLTAEEKNEIIGKLADEDCLPIFLSQKQVQNYYHGFCNKTIWPLFHYFPLNTIFETHFWEKYKEVNQLFRDEVLRIANDEDFIWVHDYQLMLLPRQIRKTLESSKIGFFLHIPFPSYELFRLLPWRVEILEGMLGADVIGFHTYDYVRHFLSSVHRISGIEHHLGRIRTGNRMVKIDAFPMGINYGKYSRAAGSKSVKKETEKIHKKIGDRKIVISIDRLDYTKGILTRLEAFELFLSDNQEYKGKVTLILLAVPSRTGVDDYTALREKLEALVSRINGEHGTIGWVPVWYLYRAVEFKKLIALYSIADVCLVTPLRDGMNLIAKEFIATRKDGKGVLVLSETAGAASELGEALIINANDKAAISRAIKGALEMPVEEQVKRNLSMQQRLKYYNISRWADDFLETFSDVASSFSKPSAGKLNKSARQELIEVFQKSQNRLFLLDYDGTLVGFEDKPEKAVPDKKIMGVLQALSDNTRNEMVIISGRDKETLTNWLGDVNMSLVAEHGAWVRPKGGQWRHTVNLHEDWKDTVRPILELYTNRTPGSMIEEKDFSLVWHYRRAQPEMAYVRAHELKDTLIDLTANLAVGVFEGNKILEIRNHSVSKGATARPWLDKEKWDFILAAGDDYTDEDIFTALPENSYSIKVGAGVSKARFSVDLANDIQILLDELKGNNFADS